MILSYYQHKEIKLSENALNILYLGNTTMYKDFVYSLNGDNSCLNYFDENLEVQDISKGFLWMGDLLLTPKIIDKFDLPVIKFITKQLSPDERKEIMQNWIQLNDSIEKTFYMLDLPLKTPYDISFKDIYKKIGIKFCSVLNQNPYDIIDTILKIQRLLNQNKILAFCNLANYLNDKKIIELSDRCKDLQLTIFDIERGEEQKYVANKTIKTFYIDQDFVDWY